MLTDISAFSHCTLCPRMCGVDRSAGKTGFCRATDKMKVARAAQHFWEEPCISGSRGSGTVFFSHCTLGCVFCQNGGISHGGVGLDVTPQRLCEIFLELKEKGAHNINLVTPTHYLPHITAAIYKAKKSGLDIPIVYNCGGYERVEVIRELSEYIDVWLPDFKYLSSALGNRYSLALDYSEAALAAVSEMVRLAGSALLNGDGLLHRGVLVRHLMLPGQLADSLKIVRLLYDRFGDDIILSLMSQYTPPADAEERLSGRFGELCRRVNHRHYEALADFAASVGFTRCYVQEPDSADSAFTPPFDGEGVLQA